MLVLAPLLHPAADLVDEFVRLNSIFCPLRLEIELVFAFFARRGDGNEIRAFAALAVDFIGDPLVGEPEVTLRFSKR
jgi:hypothetical protein